jgi:hypothetical protein
LDQEALRNILENAEIVPLDGESVDVHHIDTTFRFPKAADEFNRREYVVTLYNYEDLDSFYEDIETEGGNLYIPNRAVSVELRRPLSRNTNYRLTEEEANTIKNDPRVQDIELTLEERGHSIEPTWKQTSNQWSKSSTVSAAFDYIYYTDLTLAPTNGQVKYNAVNLSTVAELRISLTDNITYTTDNITYTSILTYLQTINDSTSAIKGTFRMYDKSDTRNYTTFAIIGNHIEYDTWFAVPITYLSGDTSRTNGTEVTMRFARTGDNNWGLLRCTLGQQQPLWGLYTLDTYAKAPPTNKGTLTNISLLPDTSYLAIIDTSYYMNNRNFIFSGNVRTWGYLSRFYGGQIVTYGGIIYVCIVNDSFTYKFDPFPSSNFLEITNGNYIHSYHLYVSISGSVRRSLLVRKLYYRSGSTVATISRFLSVVTITTNTAHGFVTGNSISVVLKTNTSLSGTYIITGASTTTFTYTTTTSGTLSSRADIGVVSLLTEKINLRDQYTINNEVYEWDGTTWWADTQVGTVITSSSGKNVDIIICDSPLNPAHPEYAKNSDGTGGSRVVQYNWFKDNLSVTGRANSTYTYTNFTLDHGAHVAGIAGGNTQGWARDANIYSLYYSATGVNSDNVLDYIKWFHQTKPINAVTGRQNPTVVNCSWGVTPTNLYYNVVARALGQYSSPPLDIYWVRLAGYVYYTRYFSYLAIAVGSDPTYCTPLLFTAQSNEIKDNSGKSIPATLSNNGMTLVTPDNLIIPYRNTYSYKFNGGFLTSIDQTIISFQTDFTIEFWIYPISTSSLRPLITCSLFGIYLFAGKITFGIVDSTGVIVTKITSTTTIYPSTWYHVVITRYKNTSITPNVSTAYLFINGTVEGSFVDSTIFDSIKDSGLGNSGGPYPFTPSVEGITSTASTIPFVNTNSYFFENKSKFLKIENTTAFGFGSGSFTFEVWVYLDGRDISLRDGENSYTLFCVLGINTGIMCYMCADCVSIANPEYSEIGTFVPAGNTLGTVYFQQRTWYHIAITRNSGTCRAFINGTLATYTDNGLSSFVIPTGVTTYYIGVGAPVYPYKDTGISSRSSFTGYMSNLRVVKGQALYTAAFTPSTVPLTTSSQGATPANVSLLTCQSPSTTITIGSLPLRAYISNLRIARFSVYRGENFTYPTGDLEGPLGGKYGTLLMPIASALNISDGTSLYYFYFPTRSTSLEADITDMINRGVIVSWAAGNEYSYIDVPSSDLTSRYNDYFYIYNQIGPLTGTGPAVWEVKYPFRGNSGSVPGCICVGNASEYKDERKSISSNFGPRIDIFAPGSNIMSSVNVASTDESADTRNAAYYHRRLTGTSMASPQVCGVLACLAETYPQLTEATALLYLKERGTKNQMADFASGVGSNNTTLGGAPNLYLYYSPEAPSVGLLYPKSNVAKTLTGQTGNVGLLYPRPRIRLR